MGIYDDLVARLEQAERERDEFRDQVQYVRDLASNKHLSAAQKWAMWAVREKLGRVAKEGEQLTEIRVYEVAHDIGMSKERTGELIQSLADAGAIARRQQYEVAEGYGGNGQQYRKRILVGLTLFSGRPKDIVPPTKRNHGGKRERCERCGGENLEIFEAYICKDCGYVHQVTLKKETKGRKGWTQRKTII